MLGGGTEHVGWRDCMGMLGGGTEHVGWRDCMGMLGGGTGDHPASSVPSPSMPSPFTQHAQSLHPVLLLDAPSHTCFNIFPS